jgi:hypothetical protein
MLAATDGGSSRRGREVKRFRPFLVQPNKHLRSFLIFRAEFRMREVELDTIPLADVNPDGTRKARGSAKTRRSESGLARKRDSRFTSWLAPAVIVILSSAHGGAIWYGLGGLRGLTNGWPIWRHDHPIYYHSGLVTRAFLKDSWTTSGYDPFFMAGYAKSIVFPSSSTLPELAIALFGGSHPDVAYKIYALVSAAAFPWLIALACVIWRLSSRASALAVAIALIYVWTDFPISHAASGMLPYFLGIPLALVASGVFARFLGRPGALNWLLAAFFLSLAFLVHLTTAMVLVPAAGMAYFAASSRRGYVINRLILSILVFFIALLFLDYFVTLWFRDAIMLAGVALLTLLALIQAVSDRKRDGDLAGSRATRGTGVHREGLRRTAHLGVWALPVVILAVNAFWWLPGVWLASTKGASDFAFVHPEGVLQRLGQIGSTEAPIESLLIALGVPGLFLLLHRNSVLGWTCIGFCVAGFGWGYEAGAARSLDFLQPGRHTFAFYTGLAVSSGAAVDELLKRLRTGKPRLDRWAMVGALLIAMRMTGYPAFHMLRRWFLPVPLMSSTPTPRTEWIVDRVRTHLKRGDRLLYEEGGFAVEGTIEPFQGGRLSGLLPERTGVEVIGGPYLHASLQTNFTQFGEGKLCGKSNWIRSDFLRYAKLYGPSAILCWSPHARRFCLRNPDLIRVLEDDQVVLLGRVIGFEGRFLEGSGRVEADAGVLRLRELTPGLDGTVVLRYHSVPYLRARPAVAIEQEYREDDPVPFIRLRPPPGTSDVELSMHLPVGRKKASRID